MVDMTAIGVALNSLNSMRQITQGMIAARDADIIRAKSFELLGQLGDALEAANRTQQEITTLIKSKDALENEVLRFKEWNEDKARYELKALSRGSFAYALKSGMEAGEPFHCLCANCYGQNKKSILQAVPSNHAARSLGKQDRVTCPQCKAEIDGSL